MWLWYTYSSYCLWALSLCAGVFFTVGKKVQGASGLLSSPLIKSGTLPKGIHATRSNKGLSGLYTSVQVKSLLENVDLSFGSWTSRPITIFHFFCLPILNGYLKTMWPPVNKNVQWHIKYFNTKEVSARILSGKIGNTIEVQFLFRLSDPLDITMVK